MNFDSYVVQDTNLSLTMPLACPPPRRKASHSKGLRVSKKAKKFGFTLAEVLITLTIIGVVAAMTIPTLLINHQKQEYVTRLKKVYSTLTNAMQMLPLERGCSSGDYVCAGLFSKDSNNAWQNSPSRQIDGYSFNDTHDTQGYLLSKVLKTQKFCTSNNYSDCVPQKVMNEYMDKQYLTNLPNSGHILLEDGTYIAFAYCISDNECIIVDVNGPKGPNKRGRDIFGFEVISATGNYPQGSIIPYGVNGQWKNSCKSSDFNSYSCTGRVLEEGAMNY